nr:hypothetical protein Iba_chr12cCG14610 [Ipomoea batatas]
MFAVLSTITTSQIPTANDTGLGPRNESKRIQNWPRVLRLAIVLLLHCCSPDPA